MHILMTRALSACLLLASSAVLRAGTIYTINFSNPGDTGTITFDSASLLAESSTPTVLAFSATVDGLNFSTPVSSVGVAVYNPDGTLYDVRVRSSNGNFVLQLDGGIQPPNDIDYNVLNTVTFTNPYFGGYTLSLVQTDAPEPATPLILGSGLLAMAWLFRRRRSR